MMVADPQQMHDEHVPPIVIMFLIACRVSTEPWEVIWPLGWNSSAGRDTRGWLQQHGLIAADYSITQRGMEWLETILQTPLPPSPSTANEVAKH